MALPRPGRSRPFFLLDPERLAADPRKAALSKGAFAQRPHGRRRRARPRRLVVTGCVAVDESGARLGRRRVSRPQFAHRGGGGVVDALRSSSTTVHERQMLAAGVVSDDGARHPVDVIVTPSCVVRFRVAAGWQLPDCGGRA